MPPGHLTAFFLFDVGDAIDLPRLAAAIGKTVPTRLATKPPTPTYIQYQQAPRAFDADAVGLDLVEGFRARVKAFDYGVVSIALTRPLPETWDAILVSGLEWQDNPRLADATQRMCAELLSRIGRMVARPRDSFLTEDYIVFTTIADPSDDDAERLLASHGTEIAQLLRGERQPLSAQERDEVLRHRISYYATDVVITTWSSAFVCDTEAGARGVLEILEFANSQLLEFRYYDRCSTPSWRERTRRSSAVAGRGLGWDAAITARHGRCTHCSSTSTSSRIAQRTR
jgi:hypothetical protein